MLLHVVASATQRRGQMNPFLGVGGEGPADESVENNELSSCLTIQCFCSMQQAQSFLRYPLLLGGNERLEAGGDPEAQLVEERRL